MSFSILKPRFFYFGNVAIGPFSLCYEKFVNTQVLPAIDTDCIDTSTAAYKYKSNQST